MKKLWIFLSILTPALATAQDKNMIPKEKWSKKFYISDEFCAGRGLKAGDMNGLSKTWKGETKKNGSMRVVDTRWYFNSPAEAVQYLKLNMPLLSESGDHVKIAIKIKDVSNLYIFNEGAGNRSMNEALGIKKFIYIFLFTVKNYLAKVSVSTEKQSTVMEAYEFAKEAAKRLNAAIKK